MSKFTRKYCRVLTVGFDDETKLVNNRLFLGKNFQNIKISGQHKKVVSSAGINIISPENYDVEVNNILDVIPIASTFLKKKLHLFKNIIVVLTSKIVMRNFDNFRNRFLLMYKMY